MYKKVILDNNIPLLMEKVNGVHSVCIGVWVKIGSRYENPGKNGISHFLEHMFFKGTGSRTAQDIATEIDSLGGELNALTSTEYTLFYVKVLNEYVEQAISILTDIFLQSTFPEADIEKEKNIVIEEIKMVADNPAEYVYELFSKDIWGEEGLGQSVLGKQETITSFTRNDLINHINKYYGAENIILACSGNFNEEKLIEHLNRTLGALKRKGEQKSEAPPGFTAKINIVTKDLSESHICLGVKGLPYRSEERYSMHLLNTILGSGISSRLFQNVRENRGLVYSIYSYHVAYFDTGMWGVYAGTDKKHVSEVVNLAVDEMRNLPDSVTADELQRARAQLKGNLILALESTSNKMTNIAKQEIYYGQYFSPEEIIKMVESVTLENVRALAQRLVGDGSFALTVYGDIIENDLKDSCKLLQ
ncbi:MAG TPA: insulinase family protein [Nitrospirae bacterium]|nr:protease 3 precursor [bacterium BMS3Abin06]HDH13302.1 insulinase family protein [Nitrospirota bacterium]HDZ00642.1 insulinase family protein [Nitrospirota bacterium]